MESISSIEHFPIAFPTPPTPSYEHPWNAVDFSEECALPITTGELSSYPFFNQSGPEYHDGLPPSVVNHLSVYNSRSPEHLLVLLHGGNSACNPLSNHSTKPAEVLNLQLLMDGRDFKGQGQHYRPHPPAVQFTPSSEHVRISGPRMERRPPCKRPENSLTSSLNSSKPTTVPVPSSKPSISPNPQPLRWKSTCQPQEPDNMNILDADAIDLSTTRERTKHFHNLAERKYRKNLSAKITELYSILERTRYCPPCALPSPLPNTSAFEGEDQTNPKSQSTATNNIHPRTSCRTSTTNTGGRKGEVITNAINYVNQAEVEMRHMETEILHLNDRVRSLEKLIISTPGYPHPKH